MLKYWYQVQIGLDYVDDDDDRFVMVTRDRTDDTEAGKALIIVGDDELPTAQNYVAAVAHLVVDGVTDDEHGYDEAQRTFGAPVSVVVTTKSSLTQDLVSEAIGPQARVWVFDLSRGGEITRVRRLADDQEDEWRAHMAQEMSPGEMVGHLKGLRDRGIHYFDGTDPAERDAMWVLCEWFQDHPQPARYDDRTDPGVLAAAYAANVPPATVCRLLHMAVTAGLTVERAMTAQTLMLPAYDDGTLLADDAIHLP